MGHKGINFDNIRQIRPGDIYCKHDNWFKIAICSPRSINGKKGTILNDLCT